MSEKPSRMLLKCRDLQAKVEQLRRERDNQDRLLAAARMDIDSMEDRAEVAEAQVAELRRLADEMHAEASRWAYLDGSYRPGEPEEKGIARSRAEWVIEMSARALASSTGEERQPDRGGGAAARVCPHHEEEA